jgi:hypothetical protein
VFLTTPPINLLLLKEEKRKTIQRSVQIMQVFFTSDSFKYNCFETDIRSSHYSHTGKKGATTAYCSFIATSMQKLRSGANFTINARGKRQMALS